WCAWLSGLPGSNETDCMAESPKIRTRTTSGDRENGDGESSFGRRGDWPLAGRARGFRAHLRPPRGRPAPLPGPPGGHESRGGAGRRAVSHCVRAAKDVRRVAHERAPVAVRDRLESVAEAPARRGPAAARQCPDGSGSPGGGQAYELGGDRCPPALP